MASCVIFDLGGVVFSSPIGRLRELESTYHMPTHTLNRFIMHSPAWKRMETGLTSPSVFAAEYDMEIAQGLAQETLHPSLQHVSGYLVMATVANGTGVPRTPYVEALRRLKQLGITTVALTNNFTTTTKNDKRNNNDPGLFSQANVVKDLFDVIVESSVVGLRKPNPDIYRLACRQAGVVPAQAVFLDDIGANLKPAKALGMHTIRVSVEDVGGVAALEQLETVLGIGKTLFTTGRRARTTRNNGDEGGGNAQGRAGTATGASKEGTGGEGGEGREGREGGEGGEGER